MSTQVKKISALEAKNELWRRGNLKFKMHPVQKEMHDIFTQSKENSTMVWLLARQSGKSWLLAMIALEQAIKEKDSIIKIVTDTKVHIKSIFDKIFVELLADCPEDIKPEYKSAQYTYYFPNGSQIQFAGTDNKHYEKLRGQKSHLVLIDEAGFCNDLEDLVKSVLLPTTTHTGGRIVLATTPPKEQDHDFYKFLEEAELTGLLTKKTIYDNPLLTDEQINRLAEAVGGINSEMFRREYLCDLIKDSSSAVFPEFNKELEDAIVKEWPVPAFRDTYVAMDLGFKDLTVILFGYYDFRADKIVIEDEIVKSGFELKLSALTAEIDKKEEELWMNRLTNEVKRPSIRVSDINYIVTQEIYNESNGKINFLPTKKDDKFAAINTVRALLSARKIIINPKCKTLIRHLRNVKWASSSNHSTFARSPDDGHYDAADALTYFVRSINFGRNPYPAGYDLKLRPNDSFIVNEDKFNGNNQINAYRQIFGMNKKRKF